MTKLARDAHVVQPALEACVARRRCVETSHQHHEEMWCHRLGIDPDGTPFALLERDNGEVVVRHLLGAYHVAFIADPVPTVRPSEATDRLAADNQRLEQALNVVGDFGYQKLANAVAEVERLRKANTEAEEGWVREHGRSLKWQRLAISKQNIIHRLNTELAALRSSHAAMVERQEKSKELLRLFHSILRHKAISRPMNPGVQEDMEKRVLAILAEPQAAKLRAERAAMGIPGHEVNPY